MHPARDEPLFAGMFPRGIEAGAARIRLDIAPRFPIEAKAIAAAVPSRRAEFLAGRELAREMLSRIGVAAVPIPVGHRRMPVWPDGIVGSIAHAGSMCVCAVAPRSRFVALGVDLEPDEALEDAVRPLICTPDELRNTADSLRMSCTSPLRALFSAKESVFKALFPLTRTELEFHQVELRWDREHSSFTPTFHNAPEEVAKHAHHLRGAFRATRGWIATAAWLEAPTSAHTPPSTDRKERHGPGGI